MQLAKSHPEWVNPDKESQILYVSNYVSILTFKSMKSKLQSIEPQG